MLSHRVERRRDKLRAVLEVDLHDLMMLLDGHEPELQRRLTEYCQKIVKDISDVGKIVRSEDSELGSVHWFDKSKGYGFIRDYSSNDIFVHYSNIAGDEALKNLEKGDRVRFKRRMGKETVEAIDVEVMGR